MNYQKTIFPLSTEDHDRVVEVWEASVRATHHFITEDDITFFRPFVREAVGQGLELACVRDQAGQVVGFVGVAQAESKIEMLFIHPDWRGQGIGRLLLRHATDVLEANTVDVNEQNEEAVGFYKRMGFVVQGRSETDGTGKPYPLLHMKKATQSRSQAVHS